MRNYTKEIIAEIDAASGRLDRRTVFCDFCHAASIALESAVAKGCGYMERHKALEAGYERIRERYGKDMEHLSKALAVVVDALEDTRSDVLGHVYEELNATNKHFGQFFTPTCVSRLMSAVSVGGPKPEPGRIVTVNDPACGAGVLLIEAGNAFLGGGGRQGDLMIYAEDIDATAADIAYVQLSLLGWPAQVTRRNTLTMKGDAPRFTIGYFLHFTESRLAAQKKCETAASA